MSQPIPAFVRRAATCACALFLLSLSAAAQDLSIVGVYAIDHEVVYSGDQAIVTLTIKLDNEGEEAAVGLAVSLVPAEVEETGDDLGAEIAFGAFERISIDGGRSARLRATVTLPIEEWLRWQAKQGPTFWLSYVDDAARPVGRRFHLPQVSSIPAAPAAF